MDTNTNIQALYNLPELVACVPLSEAGAIRKMMALGFSGAEAEDAIDTLLASGHLASFKLYLYIPGLCGRSDGEPIAPKWAH